MKIKLYVFSLLLVCFVNYMQAEESDTTTSKSKSSKKYLSNLSFNIAIAEGTSILNVGLLTVYPRQYGLGVNAVASLLSDDMNGLQMSGLMNANSGNTTGLQMAALSNLAKNKMNGIQMSGLVNLASKSVTGVQTAGLMNMAGSNSRAIALSGLANVFGDNSHGLQAAGFTNLVFGSCSAISLTSIMNSTSKNHDGLQMSAIMNLIGNKLRGMQFTYVWNLAQDVSGVQIAGIHNMTSKLSRGSQVSGIVNIATQTCKALQFSPIINLTLDTMSGTQIATTNICGVLKGFQVGIYNLATETKNGIQIGLINHSVDTAVKKYGLVNISSATQFQLMLYGGNTSKTNFAVRFLNEYGYSVLGLGTHYLDLNEKFSGCVFYRIGLHKLLHQKFRLTGDVGFYHVENFENEDATTPERMYSLQGRAGFEYLLNKRLSLFVAGGYGITRFYDRNKEYDSKPIVEVGFILF